MTLVLAPLPKRVDDARGDIAKLNAMCTNMSYDLYAYLRQLEVRLNEGLIVATSTDTLLTAIQTLLTTLNSIVSTSALQSSTTATLHTDLATTLHTDLATTLAGKLDTLHTDAGTTLHTDLATTLHTDLATTLAGKLDALHTDVGTAVFKMGQVGSIGTAADVQFSSQALVKGMRVKNISTAGQVLYLSHAATPTLTNGVQLLPGEWTNHLDCTNATAVFMRASAAGGAACYDGA